MDDVKAPLGKSGNAILDMTPEEYEKDVQELVGPIRRRIQEARHSAGVIRPNLAARGASRARATPHD